MKNFELVKDFEGYINKKDETNTSEKFLVAGSQNVIINDGEKVASRKGYSLLGAAASGTTPVESAFTWNTSTGTEIMLRGYDDELEVYTTDLAAWTRLLDGWTSADFDFTTWWDATEAIDVLLFVAKDANIYEWSGGIAEISATTSSTITKTGSTTWAQERFYTAGTRELVINGTTYAYTGGHGTTTLTGVTPDPTGEANGSVVLQKPRTNTDKPASGLTNDVIETLNNQIYVGDLTSREVYVSKDDDFTDFTFSATRLPGEGALFTFDGVLVGMVPQEDSMYFTTGKDGWFKTKFTLSDDITKEELTIEKLKSAPQGAAQAHSLIGKIKNDAVFISNEPTLDTLGRIENINTPQSRPLSDSIKTDFDTTDFTNGHVMFWKNKIYIAAPVDTKVFIYDVENGFWNPPQILPVRRFSIFGGDLYGHSSVSNETYKLFDTTEDNGAPIEFVAKFAYRNFGDRANLKNFDEYYTEIYLNSSTDITLQLDYDYRAANGSQEFLISGGDADKKFDAFDDASIGKKSIGKAGLGSTTESGSNLSKYRHYAVTRPTDFFEVQTIYKTEIPGVEFEILSHGPNVRAAGKQDNKLRS